MAAKLDRDALRTKSRRLVDRRFHVGDRHQRSSTREQLGRRDAASRSARDNDPLTRDRELTNRHPSPAAAPGNPHLNFNVVRLSSAKMIPRITNRVMTFGSLQPISSK